MRCAVAVAPVRADPREEAEQVTQLLLHEPVSVRDEVPGWALIVTSYDYAGWVASAALEEGEGVGPVCTAASPLEAARAFLGAPYEWGGMTAAGIDCSGLVHMAFRATGRLVPRDSWQQEAWGARVPAGAQRPGDVVAYGGADRADHVAFWVGEGRILHATGRESLGVVEEDEPEALGARRRCILRLQ